ncbi:MAG: hypothetical protein S4CHLAM81_00930 [Chlamydiales bacterium]|nr:hypothetical protein [Chlamydiales bacterium]MCH9634889.1 hypothetical protein [Chlamydiales bacterium]MCH9703699.1 endonuclease/exonuclease/phosphatase family protein [Chlamydiota bacterium]
MLALLALITNSVIGLMNDPPPISEEQIPLEMLEDRCCGNSLRVISFNMLFDKRDRELAEENRWPMRKERIIEYLRFADADVIGSQELQENQRADLLAELGDQYALFGREEAIFYKKKRLQFVDGRVCGPITRAQFLDGDKAFTVINTHLCFSSPEQRLLEAKQLLSLTNEVKEPLIVTGDFNTFPMRPQLKLPFYDGDYIVGLLTSSSLKDARLVTHQGHFGLISSTNFNEQGFVDEGMPGVILDHIFINEKVKVKSHAIDPALVDGLFTSDHFPLITDLCLP